jgi:hypothetical protein
MRRWGHPDPRRKRPYFAGLLERPSGPTLRVFSPRLDEIKKNAKLLERLNVINVSADPGTPTDAHY